jgi:hypothetical protein
MMTAILKPNSSTILWNPEKIRMTFNILRFVAFEYKHTANINHYIEMIPMRMQD